ncbi:MAG: apolipoprotein N-acyltransferase [Alphaproteobacteria bacterium]
MPSPSGLAAALGRKVVELRGWRRLVLASALGALAVLAFAPFHIVIVLVPSFTGLVWLIDGARARPRPLRAAFAVGWWFGFGHFAAGLYWIAFALLADASRFGWLVPFADIGVPALLAVFPALATTLLALSRLDGPARIVLLAALWVAVEWLRGSVLSGFPWNLVAYAWSFSPEMLQLSALTGAFGLSLATVASVAMPAVLTDERDGRGRLDRRGRAALAVAAMLPLALWLGGLARLAGAPEPGSAVVPGIRLRLVQAALDPALKWQDDTRDANFRAHLALTRSAGFESVSHVVWPETAAVFWLEADRARRSAVAAVVPPGGLVITGAPRFAVEADQVTAAWNSLHAIDGRGEIVGTYDKFHLVPFGEYVPLRAILPISKITHGSLDISPGPGPRTLDFPGLPPVSPLICYEAIFPGRVTDPARRPGWMLNITNDAWYGTSIGPHQHFASARVRAVEEGLPLVRAANSGISAIVDPYGRVIGRLDLGLKGVLDGPLPLPLAGPPPYARIGDWILLALLALALSLARALARRARG